MPGIPRSKGCINCRERKIRCDQTKPYCMKCTSSSRCCKGYRKRETIFINCASPEELLRRNRTQFLSPPSSDTIPKRPKPGPVFRDHFLALFLKDYLPKGEDEAIKNHTHGLSWARYMPDIAHKSKALNESLAAVSLAVLGRANSDERMIRHSFEVYGIALQAVSKALASPAARSSQDTLAAMMALSTYEVWQPTYTNGYGWIYHIRGASELVRSRGPLACESPLDMLDDALLRNSRQSLIFDALGRRKATFLASDEWQQSQGLDTNLSDTLLDLLAHLPYILERTDDVIQCPVTDPNHGLQCISLLQSFATLRDQLHSWYRLAESTIPGVLFWEIPTEATLELPFTSRLEFPALPVAQMLLIYWTAQFIMHAELERLICSSEEAEVYQLMQEDCAIIEDSFASTKLGYGGLLQTLYSAKIIQYADLAIRSEPFCCSPRFGMVGVQSVTFAMWAAQQVYDGRSEQKFQYCYDRSRSLGGSRGLFFLSLIARMGTMDYPGLKTDGFFLPSEPERSLVSWGDIEELPRKYPYAMLPGQSCILPAEECFVF